MGIFENLNNKARIDNARNDDKPGRYLQRIDSWALPKDGSGQEYVRIAKTTVAVLEDTEGQAHEVGEETTQALFQGKFDYLAKDIREYFSIGLDITPTEASDTDFAEIKDRLVNKNEMSGQIIEVLVETGGVKTKGKDKGKPWFRHTWVANRTEEFYQEEAEKEIAAAA